MRADGHANPFYYGSPYTPDTSDVSGIFGLVVSHSYQLAFSCTSMARFPCR
jgi:hypothetical protein